MISQLNNLQIVASEMTDLLPLFLLIPYKDCEYHLTSWTGNYSSILNENVNTQWHNNFSRKRLTRVMTTLMTTHYHP